MNFNPETGIAYGYISANSLDPEVVDTLLYRSGALDWSFLEAHKEMLTGFIAEHDLWADAAPTAAKLTTYQSSCELFKSVCDWIDKVEYTMPDEVFDEYQSRLDVLEGLDEPQVEGRHEGTHYMTSWLGGALNFFIFDSPETTEARPCSPCVPGAGDLNNADSGGSVLCYDVPSDWRAAD